jgi:hypothetical protein
MKMLVSRMERKQGNRGYMKYYVGQICIIGLAHVDEVGVLAQHTNPQDE